MQILFHLKASVHVTAWTQHTLFAIQDPITFTCHPLGSRDGCSGETFVLCTFFYPLSLGLVWLKGERQRAARCGVLLRKPMFPKSEPSAQALLHLSQGLLYICLQRGIRRLGRKHRSSGVSMRGISQADTYPQGGQGREQPPLWHLLSSQSLSSFQFGSSLCCFIRQDFVAAVSCFDSYRGKYHMIWLALKNDPFSLKCPQLLLKPGRGGACLATDSTKLQGSCHAFLLPWCYVANVHHLYVFILKEKYLECFHLLVGLCSK